MTAERSPRMGIRVLRWVHRALMLVVFCLLTVICSYLVVMETAWAILYGPSRHTWFVVVGLFDLAICWFYFRSAISSRRPPSGDGCAQ